jgi:ankyrin repeat protein
LTKDRDVPAISDQQKQIVNANLIDAVRESDEGKIDLCLKKGADINARWSGWRNRTPLMLAAAWGRPELVAFLLGRQPDLLAKDSDGKTVFDLCADTTDEAKRKKINRLLLEALPDTGAASAPAEQASAAGTGADITVLRPIELGPRRKGGGGLKL